MANQEHLDILKQGVEVWNQWRKQDLSHMLMQPDLSEADLSGMQLNGIDMHDTDLSGLSCFIIADITNPKSSPLELQATVPNYMVPFAPIVQEGEQPFSMFQDLIGKYDWVLDPLVYDTPSHWVKGLERAVVKPALEKRDELLLRKVEQLRTRNIADYL